MWNAAWTAHISPASRAGELAVDSSTPEDLPRVNPKAVIPEVIPASVHQPDDAALLAARNRKRASRTRSVDLLAVLIAGDLPPVLPVRRCLDEPRFQMCPARTSTHRCRQHHNEPFRATRLTRNLPITFIREFPARVDAVVTEGFEPVPFSELERGERDRD
jgi:hypothetical protein